MRLFERGVGEERSQMELRTNFLGYMGRVLAVLGLVEISGHGGHLPSSGRVSDRSSNSLLADRGLKIASELPSLFVLPARVARILQRTLIRVVDEGLGTTSGLRLLLPGLLCALLTVIDLTPG